MMTRRFLPFVVLMAVAIAVVAVTEASATTLNLDTGKSLSVAPGASGSMTFSVTNADAGNVTDFLGWVMGIQAIPAGGNVGTLSLGSLSAAASDPMPVGTIDITQPTLGNLGTAVNGTTVFYSMDINLNALPLSTLVSGRTYNLGTLSFNASADAAGSWKIYAVQENPGEKTYYNDGNLNPVQFGNLNLASAGPSVGLELGTVTVVPEPSTAGMLVVALGATGLVVRNRRSRKAIEPAKADVLGESGSRCIGA